MYYPKATGEQLSGKSSSLVGSPVFSRVDVDFPPTMADDFTDEDLGVLYDVLVYNEWEPEEENRDEEDGDDSSTEKRSSWVSRFAALNPLFNAGFWRSSGSGCFDTEEFIRWRSRWVMAAAPNGGNTVAIAQDGTLEILRRRGKGFTATARAELPPEGPGSRPELRKLAWSDDGQLIAVCSSLGAVLIFDADANLVYDLVSGNLPGGGGGEVGSTTEVSYCGVFFAPPRVGDGDWHSELILVDRRGRINSFLCSFTGYQELGSLSLLQRKYSAVTDAIFIKELALLYVSGSGCATGSLTCLRLTEEEPFFEEMELSGDARSRRSLWQRLTGGGEDDFVVQMSVNDDHTAVATAHMSGAISVWTLPSLIRRQKVTLTDQACFDDVNPHCLAKRRQPRVSVFLHHPLRFHPTAVRWWNDSALVVSRLSGGLTIMPLREPSKNLLGQSAEFFAPACQLSGCFESGFFALEVEGDRRFLTEPSETEGIWKEGVFWDTLGTLYNTLSTILQKKAETTAAGREDSDDSRLIYRLLYFQSTSPEELFSKKIEDEEYGEAIDIARLFNLNCDRVYVQQWRLSDLSTHSVKDYLGKVKKLETLLGECILTIPPTAEACQSLYRFGLAQVGMAMTEEERTEEKLQAQELLQQFLARLALYVETLARSEDFSAKEFADFRSRPLIESARQLSSDGNLVRVKALLTLAREGLVGKSSELMTAAPEPIDPLQEFSEVTNATLLFGRENSELVDEGLTPEWFQARSEEVIELSAQPDFASAVLNLAVTVGASVDQTFYHRVLTYESLIFDRHRFDLKFEVVRQMTDYKLFEVLLEGLPMKNFRNVCIPFLDRVEQSRAGGSLDLFREFLVDLSKKDFARASQLARSMADIIEESWLSRRNLLDMGTDCLWSSSSDLREIGSFLAFLQSYATTIGQGEECVDELDFAASVFDVLKVMRKYDEALIMMDVRQAKSDEDRAKEMFQRLLTKGEVICKGKLNLWSEVFIDCLLLGNFCDSLTQQFCLLSFCETLLESGDQGGIIIATEVLAANKSGESSKVPSSIYSKTAVVSSSVKKIITSYGIPAAENSDRVHLAVAACERYFNSSRDCNDQKLDLSRLCLSICDEDDKDDLVHQWRNLLQAAKILSKLRLVSPVKPWTLKSIREPQDIGKLISEHLNLDSFDHRDKCSLVSLGSCLSRSAGLDEKVVKEVVLCTLADLALEVEDAALCKMLCHEMVELNIARGWRPCLKLARSEKLLRLAFTKAEGRRFKLILLRFAAAFCDDAEMIFGVAEMLRESERDEESKPQLPEFVPGFSFFDNALEDWSTANAVRRGVLDIYDLSEENLKKSLGGEGTAKLPRQLQLVFEQDPLLATAIAATAQETEEGESLILLAKVLGASLSEHWPRLGHHSLRLSTRHLCLLAELSQSETLKILKERGNTVAPNPEDDMDGEASMSIPKPFESNEDVEEKDNGEVTEEEIELPDVCKLLAAQVAAGVPKGLRTLASALLTKRSGVDSL